MAKFAIVKYGNAQYYLEQGMLIDIPRIDAEEGKDFVFSDVLLVNDDKDTIVGKPTIKGAEVVVFIVKQLKGKKKYGVKYKAKSRYRRKWGYRNLKTRIRVKEIKVSSSKENMQEKTKVKSKEAKKKA